MKIRLFVIAFVFASHAFAQGSLTPLSPRVVDPANGYTYLLLTSGDWTESEAEARSLGGNLAPISNQAEQNWVFNTFGDYGGNVHLLWIGLTDAGDPFHFVWASGAPVTYEDWAPGEPNDAGGVEFYVAMYYPGHSEAALWNDWSNRTTDPVGLPFNGVVEIVPEPNTVSLIFAALLACKLFPKDKRRFNAQAFACAAVGRPQ
jgi:hypothetical protein